MPRGYTAGLHLAERDAYDLDAFLTRTLALLTPI
jgi:hypothetical protein